MVGFFRKFILGFQGVGPGDFSKDGLFAFPIWSMGRVFFYLSLNFVGKKNPMSLDIFEKRPSQAIVFFKDMDGVLFEHEELQIVSISSKNSNILHSCFWRSAFLKAQDWVVEDTLKWL